MSERRAVATRSQLGAYYPVATASGSDSTAYALTSLTYEARSAIMRAAILWFVDSTICEAPHVE
ncbi:MAG: hypothetical protein LC775_15290, partial [Acidobacteria bacterium]|nr:hypothetical protein [Acidobacteriota bacterium]